MKKKWIALPVALIMAGAAAFGTACESSPSPAPDPVVTVQDGYVYVDGKKTDIQINTAPPETQQKSAFELWKADNPAYTGTEAEWIEWLEKLTAGEEEPPEEEKMSEYKLIENGIFHGGVTAGSASAENGTLALKNAVLRLSESVVLPIGENASWEVDITGTLLTGTSTGAQLFVSNPFSEYGRVYIGVNKTSRMLYIGVRLNTVYVNYGWKFDDASVFHREHRYAFSYEEGVYYLSVDGGTKSPMSDINFNQANANWLEDPETDAQNLNELMRTVLGQNYIEMTNIGANEFVCNAEIKDFSVKTSSCDGYKRLVSHPLAGKKIFYLGSSITYGSASGGVAFGDIINKITGNPYVKEAVSGTTLVDNGSSSYVQRLKNGALNFAEKPDCLVVQLSTNDFSQNKPLGVVQSGTSSSDFDTSTISGAIQYIIAYAKEQCPTVKVLFYVGSVKNSWGYRTEYENYVNGDFRTICEKWDIQPLDIFHSKYKSYACFWSDDIHPTAEGYCAGWTPLFVKYFEEQL